jgi:hypothetical protein
MAKLKMELIRGTQKVINLAPEYKGQLALVDFKTLQRLANQLPKVMFSTIKESLRDRITACRNLEEMTALLEDELAFHSTVNMISTVEPNDIEEAQQQVSQLG